MKLVELLARELYKWPDAETVFIVQDDDGGLKTSRSNDTPTMTSCGVWQRHGGGNDPYLKIKAMIASDHATAIVTREMWQAERERIAKPGKKANADGWIRHRGGKCPVEAGTVIEYRLRKRGVGIAAYPEQLNWGHDNHIGDIMAYRIINPAEQPINMQAMAECAAAFGDSHADVMGSVLSRMDGPLQWRDRIREIDRTVEALEEERVSLIQRLEGEGFKIIEQVNAKIAEAAQAHEDMSDPSKWRKGDLITFVLDRKDSSFTTGKQYTFNELDGYGSASIEADDEGDVNGWSVNYFKWHSRPSA